MVSLACNPRRNAAANGAESAARDTFKSFPPAAEYPPPARVAAAVAGVKYSADKTGHGETALAAYLLPDCSEWR